MRTHPLRRRAWTALAVAASGVALATSGAARVAPPAQAGQARPNILLILTDDQAWNLAWGMPNYQQKIVAKGVEFKNGFAANPLCCPSRATILTGEYSHTTGVWTNGPPQGTVRDGGFWAFQDDDDSTVATWLDDAGYRTGYFGKYLNGYKRDISTYIPPGWDRWVGMIDRPKTVDIDNMYYTYSLSVDGRLEDHGSRPSDYGTDVLTNKTVRFLKATSRPFFALYSPPAPHGPPIPAPRHEDAYPHFPKYRPPNYNELDVSDKPTWVQELPLLTSSEKRGFDRQRHGMFKTLLAVDDAIARFIKVLRESGELHNTAIIFLSDNGYVYGEHRRHHKREPYEEGIRIPFAIRYDNGIPTPKTDDHIVANLDVAETITDLADVPRDTAGRSLTPLFTSADPDPVWRSELLLELGDDHVVPAYCGLRTERYKYVALESTKHDGEQFDDEELYDLSNDRYELNNLASDPASMTDPTLIALLADYRQKVLDQCSPPPPGWQFNPEPLPAP